MKFKFKEEIGFGPKGDFISIGKIKQKSGKIVKGWSFEGDWNGLLMCQSLVEIEWQGRKIKVLEIDKAGFFSMREAKKNKSCSNKNYVAPALIRP